MFVYICHPLRGNEELNRECVRQICRAVKDRVQPIAPHLALLYLDEATERQQALDHCLRLLERCDELWQYGEPTEGMALEIEHAHTLEIPVRLVPKGMQHP